MASQENTAINNLLQLVAAHRVGFEPHPAPMRPRTLPPLAAAPPAPRPPVRPIFHDDDDDAATAFVDRDDNASTHIVDHDNASTHLVARADDDASTHFVERFHGRVPEATPRHAWSPSDMRSTAERMVDVVSLRPAPRTAPRRAVEIPSLRRPDATPHAMEAPALGVAVAVPTPYAQMRQPQPLGREVRHTLRRLAAPITFVALFAISLSTYLALAGGNNTVATAAAAPAPVVRQERPTAPPPAPAAKVEVASPAATIPDPNEAERPANVAADRTGEETTTATEDEAEIEMEPVGLERPRRERPRVEPKKEPRKEPKKEPEKEQPKETKVAEGELPANVANKTSTEMGTILVTSNVAALIYLDGRNTGMMTPKQFSVPAGPHKITLLEPDSKKARTQDVKVLPGKTASVAKQF